MLCEDLLKFGTHEDVVLICLELFDMEWVWCAVSLHNVDVFGEYVR